MGTDEQQKRDRKSLLPVPGKTRNFRGDSLHQHVLRAVRPLPGDQWTRIARRVEFIWFLLPVFQSKAEAGDASAMLQLSPRYNLGMIGPFEPNS
jgi:hypothetical protein